MARQYKKNYPIDCHECGKHFMALRPGDKFCTSACRWRNRDKQPDRIRAKAAVNKQWRSWNFDYRRDYMLRFNYGITQEQFEEMLAEQGGGCAICGKTPEEEGRNLAVDHDHKTGEIYGILCSVCNKVLVGHIREPAAFDRAAAYLREGTGRFVPVRERPVKRKPLRNDRSRTS